MSGFFLLSKTVIYILLVGKKETFIKCVDFSFKLQVLFSADIPFNHLSLDLVLPIYFFSFEYWKPM